MKIYLEQCYGGLQKGVGYALQSEGPDYFLLKNGYHVPKILVKTSEEIAEEESFFDLEEEEED